MFGGVPQVADPQSLIFSPMVLLALLAPHSFHALDVAVLAMLALGGVAILMYFRDRGWHLAGGIVAALALAFGASAAWRIQHIGQIESFVFFAITLWLLARALERASVVYGVAAGIAGGLMLVQPDQVAYLAALFLIGFVVDRWLALGGFRAPLWPTLNPLIAAGISGIVIIAVPILLAALYATSSDRTAFSMQMRRADRCIRPSLLTMLVGGLFSPMYEVPYWGPTASHGIRATFFLSPNAEPALRRRFCRCSRSTPRMRARLVWEREIRFYAFAAIALIVYALGCYTPLYRLIFELPGVSAFRRPADATFMLGGTIAILGGYLVHRIASGTIPPLRRWHQAAAIALVAAFIVAALAVAVSAGHLHDAIGPITRAVGWVAASAFALFLLMRIPARMTSVAALVVAPLMVADLALNNGPSESTGVPPSRFDMLQPNTQNETILLLKRVLRQQLPSNRRDRVELLAVGFEWPNAPMIHGFEQTLGYNPLRLIDVSDSIGARDYKRVFSPLFPSYQSLLADMLGLRYIVSSVRIGEVDLNLQPGDLPFLAHTRYRYVYETARCRACCSPTTGWRPILMR